ncbi:hypothetical protein [Endozoicomonas lisbonensis]|uniref:SprT family Zn-dependent metalloprotease n=1 Tax=Endozoicomonas lisbonensis TaxID=3120522 RepID=A0ABV2SFW9_9GAMM
MDVGQLSSPEMVHSNLGFPIDCDKLKKVSHFAGFSVREVVDKLNDLPPSADFKSAAGFDNTFWFTNEYHGGYISESATSLKDTFKEIKEFSPVSQRRISIVTGESGLLSCLPELARLSNLVILIDQNPILLFFLFSLFNKLSEIEDCRDEEYADLIKSAFLLTKDKVEGISFSEENALLLAMKYKEAFNEWHCFSSRERLEETKKALEKMHIHPLCTNYYDEESMKRLAKIISDEELDIVFFNMSNVLEYYHRFFEWKRYPCPIKGVDNTLYLNELPFTEETLCAYSTLIYCDERRAMTCTGDVFFEKAYQLHKLNIYYDVCGETLGEEKTDKDLILDACMKLAQMDPGTDTGKLVLHKLRNLLAHSSEEALSQLSENYHRIQKTLDKNKPYQSSSENEQKKYTFLSVIQLACGEAGLKINRYNPSSRGRRKKKAGEDSLAASGRK